MRNIVLIAIVALIAGGYVADKANKGANAKVAAKTAEAQQPRPVSFGPRIMKYNTDASGHFRVEAKLESRATLNFVVDTGASVVVLRESDAARVGLTPSPMDYTARVSTANGVTKAAPMRIDRVEVGDITLRDVRAMVMPDRALSTNLLGVSFLSRLKRYEVSDGRLVLEQ